MDNQSPGADAAGRDGKAASTSRRGFLTIAVATTLLTLLPTPRRLNVSAELLGVLLADGVDTPYAALGGKIVPWYNPFGTPTPTEAREIEDITAALLAGDHVEGPSTLALKAKLAGGVA